MTRTKKKLLLIAQRPSDFTEMYRVAEALARRGHNILLQYHYQLSSKQHHLDVLRRLRELDFEMLPIEGDAVAFEEVVPELLEQYLSKVIRKRRQRIGDAAIGKKKRERPEWRKWIARYTPSFIKNSITRTVLAYRHMKIHVKLLVQRPIRRMLEYIYMIRIYSLYSRFFLRYIRQNHIDAIIIPEDIVGYIWPVAVKAAHKQKIPCLIFPYTIANQQEAFQGVRFVEDFQTKVNWVTARLFPRWRMRQDGADLVRLPGTHIVAHEIFRITPPLPWMMNSGYADVIGVENQAMADYYKKAGIPERRLRIIGTVNDDMLYEHVRKREEKRAQLGKEIGIDPQRPILLLGGCPNQLAGEVPHCEFGNMEEIARHIADCTKPLRDSFQLVVRPHPNYPEFGKMMVDGGYIPTMIDTARLVAVCDLYIAFASATIRWSIACGIPTVNYDIFHYGYDDFASVQGVFNVKEPDEFCDTIRSLRPDGSVYAEASEAIGRERAYWSMMDGACVDRMEALIEEFCDSRMKRTRSGAARPDTMNSSANPDRHSTTEA